MLDVKDINNDEWIAGGIQRHNEREREKGTRGRKRNENEKENERDLARYAKRGA